MDTFTKPLIIQYDHPHFKWFIPTYTSCLNIFCTPTWNDHAIYIHLLQIFSHTVSHMLFVRVQAKSSLLNKKVPKTRFTQMLISSSFIQALPELLITQRDWSSSSSDPDSYLAARKTTNGFNLVLSALAAKHTLTIHFSCSVVFRQTDFAPCLSIVELDTMPFQTDVSSIAIILEGGYLHLIESLRACRIYRTSLSINCSRSCYAVVVLRCSKKTLRSMKLLTHPLLATKEISHFHHIHFRKNISP